MDGAEGDLRYDTHVGETQEQGYQEDPPEEELRSLQEQERSKSHLGQQKKHCKKLRGQTSSSSSIGTKVVTSEPTGGAW